MSVDLISSVRVENVHVSPRTLWRHIILTTQDGLTGIGEATLASAAGDMDPRLERAARILIGKKPNEASLTVLASLLNGDITDATIFSALEQAIMDLQGQQTGKPCFLLLQNDASAFSVPLYANINRKTQSRQAKEFAANALAAEGEGFCAVKLAPFDDLSPLICDTERGRQLMAAGIDRIAAVVDAVSSATEVQVDCHWRFSSSAILHVIDQLAELGVRWLECPLPEEHQNIDALVQIRQRTNAAGMRLAGLENFCGWKKFEPFVLSGCYDVIMPDIKHCGGYRSMMEIARKAERSGVAVSPHNPSGPICHHASVHAATAIGGPERLEIQWRETPMFECITKPAAAFDAATSRASERPGLGMTLSIA